ncbi:hypothetical protein BZB76_4536 [Actinomadura pelletieri DSM 43383]|uniref:Uncharacterized protein n=1 Tax=Actinomadura pelletieri DSM 43383 TaxID=1120940 RepID=A0A495QHT5_9ACTN|nr:hypothetical protein BZB76_4536 [Actinomadura pelletieri DSM 43383]
MTDPQNHPFCDRCGEPTASTDHTACRAARELEPPRYCPQCRRRMIVQVSPLTWTAHCTCSFNLDQGCSPGGSQPCS